MNVFHTSRGVELVLAAERFDDECSEIERRLSDNREFYRGMQATLAFEGVPARAQVEAVERVLKASEVGVRGCYGDAPLEEILTGLDVPYLGPHPRPAVASFERKRAAREVALTERARSLEPDFAGARADIARRRARGEASVSRPSFGVPPEAPVPAAAAPATPAPVAVPVPATLYHRGTLRGGQSLQQLGTIVVVGDVNPGAELVASGDVVVFGSLRGTAHAGAGGDASARVLALELAPTQLRIATFIASGDARPRGTALRPEMAFVEGDRIVIAPHDASVVLR